MRKFKLHRIDVTGAAGTPFTLGVVAGTSDALNDLLYNLWYVQWDQQEDPGRPPPVTKDKNNEMLPGDGLIQFTPRAPGIYTVVVVIWDNMHPPTTAYPDGFESRTLTVLAT